MRRVNAQLQSDRRTEILDAAERCFARSGFHGASMQEICAEAGMSPGNLYRYFRSKEELIAGISERNRAEAAASFAAVGEAPYFFDGLAALGRQHLVERSEAKSGSAPRSWRRAGATRISRSSTRPSNATSKRASPRCCGSRSSAAKSAPISISMPSPPC